MPRIPRPQFEELKPIKLLCPNPSTIRLAIDNYADLSEFGSLPQQFTTDLNSTTINTVHFHWENLYFLHQ